MPRKRRLLNIRWPDGGLAKRQSYTNQPPFTTPDCLNVRPEGPLQRRLRGGTRPGLNKYYAEQISGASNPIRMLSQCTIVKNDGFNYYYDDFTSTAMSGDWTAASDWGNALPQITDGTFANLSTTNTQVGAYLAAFSPTIDTSQDYLLELKIVPDPTTGSMGGTYSLFARLDNTTPAITTEGVVATITMNDATEAWTVTLTEYNASVATTYTGTSGAGSNPASPGVLSMLVSGDNITVYWRGTTVINAQAVTAQTGTRVGFGMNCSVTGGVCAADYFRAQYYTDDVADRTRTVTIASANGELWRDLPWIGQMTQLTTNLSIASDRAIDAAERAQKLYIADRGDLKARGTNGARGTGNDKFDSASYADWTTLGLSTYDDVLVVSSATGDLIDGTYQITAIGAGELTVSPNIATGASGTCTFRIERGPKIYDPVADTLTLWTATGAPAAQVPSGCKSIELYRDRLVLTKETGWYMSAVGDPLDWDYSGELVTSAVAGVNSDAGEVGEIIESIKSFNDDYLIFGCKNSTYVLRGDPKLSGVLGPLTKVVGALDADAMCLSDEGIALFMTHDGLFALSPGSEQYPKKMSDQLPEDLSGLLSSANYIACEFDSDWSGAYIIITPNATATTLHYWFDWQRRSYWPIQFPNTADPTKIHRRRSHTENETVVLFGCRDGYIRYLDRNAPTDDGTSITSYLVIGPIRAGGDHYFDGNLETIEATLSQDSGDVDWEIYIGDTHEDVVRETTATDSGTWTQAGKQFSTRVRLRAGSFMVKIANNGDTPWLIEDMHAIVEQTRQRRRY